MMNNSAIILIADPTICGGVLCTTISNIRLLEPPYNMYLWLKQQIKSISVIIEHVVFKNMLFVQTYVCGKTILASNKNCCHYK